MKNVDRDSFLMLGVITIIGLAIRISIPLASVFPLNDGGLFYRMILDLEANHWRLPVFTTYNAASIPFAYPPLAFYLYGVLNLATRIPLLDLMRYAPAIVSAASIVAFYFLAQKLLRSRAQVLLATLVFTFIPRAFAWSIMGGGVTRSLGMLFALLAIRQAHALFSRPSRSAVLSMILLGSLVVYTHPEAATHTAISAALFFLWIERSKRGFCNGCLAIVGIAALTSPWWLTVIARHGLDPFMAARIAAQEDSYGPLAGLLVLFRFDFGDEPHVTLLTVLGLMGLILQLGRRQYLLPVWLFAMHVLEPRGGTLFMMIPLGLCAGVALDEMILPTLRTVGPAASGTAAVGLENDSNWLDVLFKPHAVRLFLGFVFVYGMMSAYETAWRVGQQFTLTDSDLQALAWVDSNTSKDSRFAIITLGLPLRDATSEWFPAITGRQSLGTVFGYEWVKAVDFAAQIKRYGSLQDCAPRGVDCLESWSAANDVSYDYVYIRDGTTIHNIALAAFLSTSPDYRLIYSSPTIEIFEPK